MSFEPNTKLYGREVRLIDDEGVETGKGILREIKGPFLYVLEQDGKLVEWEVGQSTDFDEDEEGLYLWCAY